MRAWCVCSGRATASGKAALRVWVGRSTNSRRRCRYMRWWCVHDVMQLSHTHPRPPQAVFRGLGLLGLQLWRRAPPPLCWTKSLSRCLNLSFDARSSCVGCGKHDLTACSRPHPPPPPPPPPQQPRRAMVARTCRRAAAMRGSLGRLPPPSVLSAALLPCCRNWGAWWVPSPLPLLLLQPSSSVGSTK